MLVACALLLPNSCAQTTGPSASTSDQTVEALAIVVNVTNPVQDISFSELRRIFLGERSHWPNGRRITLVMMEPNTAERKTVLHEICRMNEDDFRKNFLQRLFTGEAIVSPKTLASPIGVRKFIFNVPGAIGYVRATDVDSSVKVLRIDGRMPDDKAYRLVIDAHASK
jgi:ABC-type phosphate transport system substrate-binding protein